MVLVDTSVWVDHLCSMNARLGGLLDTAQVCCHSFVIGEVACGNLRQREQVLGYLAHLPRVDVMDHEEVLELVTLRRLMGTGIGWVDAHLLAASLVAGVSLWTMDRSLAAAARRLGISDQP